MPVSPLPWHHALAALPDDVAVDRLWWPRSLPVPVIVLCIDGRRVTAVPRFAPSLVYFVYVGQPPADQRSLVGAERVELAGAPAVTAQRIHAAALKAIRRVGPGC